MKHLVICAILPLFFLFSQVNAQELVYPITNYTTRDYGRDFHPTNMSIAQDQRGIIYAANSFKLLEFDGHSWNSYPINKETWILSLAIDRTGIVYAGSQNEFGYFAPDNASGLKYVSLSDSLDIKDLDFTNIWKVNTFSDGVVFQAEEKLFIYRNKKLVTINPETSFHTSFIVNDVLYVRQRETGLMVLNNDSLIKIDGSELFESAGIFLMVPFTGNGREILIGTRENGFWIFNPGSSDKFRKFEIKNLSLINDAKITGGILLKNGTFALSTLTNGIIVIDTSGNIVSVINQNSGLADNDVKQIITDNNQNLWLALNNGISTIVYSSPLSFYTEKSGIEGTVNTVLRHDGELYAGTSAGLFVQNKNQIPGAVFLPLQDLSLSVMSLIEVNGSLVAGTDAGIYEIQKNDIKKVSDEESYSLYFSSVLNLILSGSSKGLSVFTSNYPYKKINLSDEIQSDIISITGIEPERNDSSVFWIGTRNDGAIRLIFKKDFKCSISRYNVSDGLAAGPVRPFHFEGEIIFGTSTGLYKFINENIVKESLPDSLKDDPDFLKGYFTAYAISGDSIGTSVSVFAEKPGRVWICADNQLGYLNKNEMDKFIRKPFMGIDAGNINTIYAEPDDICWFGTSDGLLRYNSNSEKNYSSAFLSLIRKVTLISSDSLILSGPYFTSDSNGYKITTIQPEFLKPDIHFKDNSIRLDFAATYFENPDKMLFSCQLEGYDTTWTNWENKYYQEYTNLYEGNYIFHVKAKNVYGKESVQSLYSFIILPPWYRSLAAYILYGIASLLMVWLIASLYSFRLKRENIRLEGIVGERTAEVVRQRDVLGHQKQEIEDSIRYASRIQSAVLPASHDFSQLIPDSFVFFRPRDIVSGDFYWIGQVGNKLIISAADCTGHGVPGAFMSMLGVAFLNEIVNKDHITSPEIILNRLREKVIESLQQRGISGEANDGMDIVVICIDEETKKLYYSGAYNPLVMIREKKLSEIHADRMPIAIFDSMKEFLVHEIPIRRGDIFYFFSDGYEDQFGGPDGKKFKTKRFKQLLTDICENPMSEQKNIIEKTFEDWKGDLPQVDDIVVIGIRI